MDRKDIEEKIIILKDSANRKDIPLLLQLIKEYLENDRLAHDIGLIIEIAVIFECLNNFSESKKYFLKALSINPKDEYAIKGLLKSLLYLQEYEQMDSHIEYLLQNYIVHKQYILQLIKQIIEKMYQYEEIDDKTNISRVIKLLEYMQKRLSDEKVKNILINEIEIMQNKKILNSKPRTLALLVTSRCNIKCKMCSIPEQDWTFPSEKNSEILKLMPYLEEIIWHGGEPLLYPHIYDLITEASKYDIQQTISTNALLLDEVNIKKLLATNIELNVSIHGLDKSTYESIHVNGNFDKLISKLLLIKKIMLESKSNIKYGLKFLVMKSNYKQMLNIYEFVKQYGFNHVHINILDEFTIGDENILYYSRDSNILEDIITMSNKLRIDLSQINVFYEAWLPETNNKISKNDECNDKKIKNEKVNKIKIGCYIPWKKIHIDMNGNVRNDCFCNNIVIGNINTDTIENIWNAKTVVDVRNNIINSSFDKACSDGCKNGRVSAKYLKAIY
ncbi:MAG: radical SAM protein [Endomicrobiaceae bacterium]|nr:radical SAM protein [Endomicrobiaceae bacterium]